jgi:hypothetical protein
MNGRFAAVSAAWLGAMIMLLAFMCLGRATAQEADHCLGNAQEWTVAPGVHYQDSLGVWVCAPGHPGATAGGWVLVTPSAHGTVTQPATPQPDNSLPVAGGLGALSLWFALGAAGIGGLALAGGCAVVVRHIRTPRLRGWLVTEEDEDAHEPA